MNLTYHFLKIRNLLFVALFFLSCNQTVDDVYRNFTDVCFDNACIFAEVSITPEERTKGLMYRTELSEDQGMLFIFDQEGIYPFWMKNTYIPLDIIWLDSEKRIVHIENAKPCVKDECVSYVPSTLALYVIEVPSGFVEKYQVFLNQTINFELNKK